MHNDLVNIERLEGFCQIDEKYTKNLSVCKLINNFTNARFCQCIERRGDDGGGGSGGGD